MNLRKPCGSLYGSGGRICISGEVRLVVEYVAIGAGVVAVPFQVTWIAQGVGYDRLGYLKSCTSKESEVFCVILGIMSTMGTMGTMGIA